MTATMPATSARYATSTTYALVYLHGRLVTALRRHAATSTERPEWAHDSARMILDLEAEMWRRGVTPPPRPIRAPHTLKEDVTAMHDDYGLDLRDLTRDQRRNILRVLHTIPDLIGQTHLDVTLRDGESLPIDEIAGDADQLDELAAAFAKVWPDAADHLEQLAAGERVERGEIGPFDGFDDRHDAAHFHAMGGS